RRSTRESEDRSSVRTATAECDSDAAQELRSGLRWRYECYSVAHRRLDARFWPDTAMPGADPDSSASQRNDCGVRKLISTPRFFAASAIIDNVRTTPLTWGCHASVAIKIRIRRHAPQVLRFEQRSAADRS